MKLPAIEPAAITSTKTAVLTEDNKAAIPAVAGGANEHRRQAKLREGQTSSKFDVSTE